jgi:hypothetical protein
MSVLKRALLAAVLVTTGCGCGSQELAGPKAKPEPIARHLAYAKVVGEKGIWIADTDGSNPRLLINEGTAPEISPDGKWVAYLDEPVGNLYVIKSDGEGDPKLLARGQYSGPKWSPDSERIAAELWGEQRGHVELVSFPVESGRHSTVMRGDRPWGWSFSPDGKQIVYGARTGPNPDAFDTSKIDLFVTSRDGGDPKQITDTGDSAFPVWGPKSIAFAKLIPRDGWGRHEIWRIKPDGTGRETVTGPLSKRFLMHGCVGLLPIEWSQDGSALLAAWECEFSTEPVAVDPATGETRLLGLGLTVGLSDDGQFALVDGASGAQPPVEAERVLIYPFEGGKPKVLVQGAGAPSWNR